MNSELEWGLEQEEIFRNQITFFVGPCNCFRLQVLPTFLSVQLCALSGVSTRRIPLPSVCNEVRRSIDSAVSEVSKALHCSQRAAHSFGFFCPEDVDANQSPHPATVTYLHGEPFNLKCPSSQKRFDLPEGCQVWFSEVGCKQYACD